MTQSLQARATLRQQFIDKHQWGDADLIAQKSDASFRQYWRLRRPQKSVMLMDAPPPHENVRAFIQLTQHLQKIGVRVPQIYAIDSDNGFLLLEDLGTQTFTRLLSEKHDAMQLYRQAITVLSHIHQHAEATAIDLPNYDTKTALAEANLLLDWYIPARLKQPVTATARQQFQQVWQQTLAALPPLAPALVLRDYHVDNLMQHNGQCALLDYQDAVIGSPAYDLISLLEDARCDINLSLADDLLESYLAQNHTIERHVLHQHCIVWGAQRHCKVAGLFVRLWLRDGKSVYLKHLPRVMKLLQRHLDESALQPLRGWLNEYLGELNHVAFSTPAHLLADFCETP